jgi:hypothetical protein
MGYSPGGQCTEESSLTPHLATNYESELTYRQINVYKSVLLSGRYIAVVKKTFRFANVFSTTTYTILLYSGTYF